MIARLSILVGAALILCAPGRQLMGQGGSNYSTLGFGDLRLSSGALYDGMAGTSIAMPNDHGINVVNPALLGMSNFTRLQASYRFSQHSVTARDGSTNQYNGEVDGILALFSIDTAMGLGVNFGVTPYSSMNYAVERVIGSAADSTRPNGRSSQIGSGGVSTIQLGASYRILPILYAGVSTHILFGLTSQTDEVGTSTYSERVRTLTGFDVRGLLLRSGLYLRPNPSWSIGAFVSGGADASYTVTRSVVGFFGTATYYDTTTTSSGTTGLPFSYGLGVSFNKGRTMLGADLEIADLSSVTMNVPQWASLGQFMRLSIGFSQTAAGYAPTFFDKLGYRAGIAYQRQYYTVNGQDVNEYFGSFGMDFPLGGSATVDLALQGGFRGPSTGLQEYFGRFMASVSIGELWFRPFARD
ncbi:MAG: hypothetical protein FGM33_05860 [Candidatus Kapabacteria bacterium]|nr:hypothetical protein [Candidatus Kapabacteria bacterium]